MLILQTQNQHQQSEISGLKAQADAQKQAVNAGLEDWAKANGLDAQVAQNKVLEWARNLQAQPGVSAERRALAAFALKNYGEAADLFGEATDDEMASLDQLKKQQQEQNRLALQKILETTQQRANALQLAARFHEATAALQKTHDYIEAQQKQSPNDTEIRNLWLVSLGSAADARKIEGDRGPARGSLQLLAQSLSEFQKLAPQFLSEGNRLRWAETQLSVGDLLLDQPVAEDLRRPLVEQAVQAYRNALTVYTADADPVHSAQTEMALGLALNTQCFQVDEDLESDRLFEEAAQYLRKAAADFKKAEYPRGEASAQQQLGEVFAGHIMYTNGARSQALFADAMQSFHASLNYFTQADHPLGWTSIQTAMGFAFQSISFRQEGEESAHSLDLAVQVFENALDVYTQKNYPQDWAGLQNQVAAALDYKGEKETGAQALQAFDAASQHVGNALQVFTREDRPQKWLVSQYLLAKISKDRGDYRTSAAIYEDTLEINPSTAILPVLVSMYHEKLFRFDRALELQERVLKAYPGDSTRMDYVEDNLTAEHFAECIRQADMVGGEKTSVSTVINRDTMELACQWGNGNKSAALAKERTLIQEAANVSKGSWNYEGTLHFLSISPTFEFARPAWIALFTAVQNGEAAAMTKALHDLEPIMQN